MLVSRITTVTAGILLILTGCRGPVGLDGAKGDPGEQGTTGDQGPQGTAGQDGADGESGTNGQDGVDGIDGQDGADGHDGADGQDGQDGTSANPFAHVGEGPWGIHLEILGLSGATGPGGNFQVGDSITVTYSLLDDDGLPYDPASIYRIYFNVAGPTENYQLVMYRSDYDVAADSIYNADDTWSYTFAAIDPKTASSVIPATYLPPLNDTTDLGDDQGDWGGLPLLDGTYTVAGWAYESIDREDGSHWYEADNDELDFLLGNATALEPRDIAPQANCANCHGEDLYAHGGSRRDLLVCDQCHTNGAEDDTSVTPGLTISMGPMIHKIHAGSALTTPYVVNEGTSDAADFSEVVFPSWPMGVADCEACHAGATQTAAPSRQACGSCHDDIDFSTSSAAHIAQADDAACTLCHPYFTPSMHQDPRTVSTANTTGVDVNVIGVTGGTGSNGNFQAGDTLAVEFEVLGSNGTAYTSLSGIYSGEFQMTGPMGHPQMLLEAASGTLKTAAAYDSATGHFTYSFPTPIPAVYPLQKNDTGFFTVADGNMAGQPIVDGGYDVAINIVISFNDANGVGWRDADVDIVPVLVGAATTPESRDVIDEANCLSCHSELRFHGGNRETLDYCFQCHTAGGEDRYSQDDPTVTPGTTIDFMPMIHKIHNGSNLTQVYDIAGYGSPYVIGNYNDIVFPRFDGETEVCTACHAGNDAWQDPSTRACTSCHDSVESAAHADINTSPTYGESCDICHGPYRDAAVLTVHNYWD